MKKKKKKKKTQSSLPVSTYPTADLALRKLEGLHPGDLVVFCLAPAHSGIGSSKARRRIGTFAMYLNQTKNRAEFSHLTRSDLGRFAPEGCCDLLVGDEVEIYHCIWFNKFFKRM